MTDHARPVPRSPCVPRSPYVAGSPHVAGSPYVAGSPRAAGPGGVLVIGVGNDLRGDDGGGRVVVEELSRTAGSRIRAVWTHQLVPELAQELAEARLAIFVDVRAPARDQAGTGPAGTASADRMGVAVRRLSPTPPAVGGHQGGPGALLGLARLAGFDVPEAYLVSLPAHEFGVGSPLSAPTRAAVAVAVEEVLRLADGGATGTNGGERA